MIALLVLACKPEPGATSEPVASKSAAAVGLACPEGTTQRGAAPPDGQRVWCETSGGVSHGPFRSWYADGKRKAEGSFDQGEADGEWSSWYETGQLRSRGRYERGAPVGDWERFERDGTEQEAKAEAVAVPDPQPQDPPPIIGILECDLYIDRYRKCIDAKAPLAAKPAMMDAFDKTIEVWKEAAAGPGRDALAQGCKAAYDAVKKAVSSWGCDF